VRVALASLLALAALAAGSGASAAGGGGGPAGRGDGPQATGKRPNVILIVTDDQTLDSYVPDVMPHTKRLLERGGTAFTNAFVTTPLCCPSRASILTGQYGHNNGVLTNEYGPLIAKGNTLPAWLREAGYRTMHVGRYLNFYEESTGRHEVAPGWDEWRSITGGSDYFDYDLELGGRAVRYGHRDEDYVTRVINERSVHLIERYAPRPEPFYLQIDHIAPHQGSGARSVGCKSSPIPDPRDAGRFRDWALPPKPSFNEEDVSDKPSFIRELPSLTPSDGRRLVRRYRCGLASLRAVDRGVRELFRALKDEHELSQTVIVFTSDNGYYFGEHRIPDKKHNPYEEGIRVPLVIRLPKELRAGEPRIPTIRETVANIDLAPSIVQLAGARPCARPGLCRTMDGRSLVPLIRGTEPAWPPERDLVIELARLGAPKDVGGRACTYFGLRTPGTSGDGTFYVQHSSAVAASGFCEPVDERELYDLAADPFQLDNRAVADPESRSALELELAARLAELHDCAGLAGRDPLPASGHYCE
jgi:arylsulfatase A-like enzyme